MDRRRLLLLLCLLASACAPAGEYPSLRPRPIEQALAAGDAEPPAAAIPDDPALAAKADTLVARARGAQAEFEAAYGPASAAVGRAGAAGSDSWVEGQQALSRLEASRGATAALLADLDGFAAALAHSGRPASAADGARLGAAMAEIQAISDAQQERLDRLRASLRPI